MNESQKSSASLLAAESLSEAVKEYQRFAQINVTGKGDTLLREESRKHFQLFLVSSLSLSLSLMTLLRSITGKRLLPSITNDCNALRDMH